MTRKQAFMTVIVAAFALAATRPAPGAFPGSAGSAGSPNHLWASWSD